MNCNEILELISAEVDGELNKEIKPAFYEHLSKCSRCKNEFELEQLTKKFLSKKLKYVIPPSDLKNQIFRQIKREIDPSFEKNSPISRIFKLPRWQIVTALAGSAAIILLILLLSLPITNERTNIAPINNNIIHHVYNNFNGIINQKLIPAVGNANPESAQIYFNRDINFPAVLPPMKNCKFLGATFSEYAKVGTAHLVYRDENDIIYILEAALEDIEKNHTLTIPDDIFKEVIKNRIYFENRLENYSLALWIHDKTLCCAITHVDNQKLISYLTNN